MQRDCPNKRVLVVKADGGYSSASDFDDDTRCGGINPYTLTARHRQAQTRWSGPLHDDAGSRSSGWSLVQVLTVDKCQF
jgi:hypothetical protein